MVTEGELQSTGIKAAAKAANKKSAEVPTQITLSNGVVLKVKPMPPMLLNSVANSIPEPEVPKVYLEDKGREEPNPNHPAYLRAVSDRAAAISLAMMNLILYACTEVISIPEGVMKVTDDGWLRLAKMAGINFDPDDEVERYIAWLRCYAVQTVGDLNLTQTVPLRLAGITEAEVEEAMESFRGGEGRDADSGLPVEIGSPNGHHLPDSDPGSGSGD